MDKDVIEIDVAEIFLFMLRKWYLFIVSIGLTMAIGLGICFFLITPKYESTTKIIILSQQNSGALTYSDLQMASQLTKDYEELIVSRDVLESVIEECSLKDSYDELLDRVSVKNVTDTRIIAISVEDPSPKKAKKIADKIRETAAEHIKNVTDVEAVNVVETANLPDEKSSPSTLMWGGISAVIGFLLVFVILLIRYLSDDTIKSSEDVEKYLGLTTLALVPEVDMGQKSASRKRK